MTDARSLPVRVYQTDSRINLAAPMPGLEPADIMVSVIGDRVKIQSQARGRYQDAVDLLLGEWTIGSYCREIVLSEPVSGALANATYGNGVLVLSMPRVGPGGHWVGAEIRLAAIDSTRGEHVGHVGRAVTPATTEEHLAKHRLAATPHLGTLGMDR